MSSVDDFINKLQEKDQRYALGLVSLFQEIFQELSNQGYLRQKLRGSVERAKFSEIIKCSNKLFDAYNMLFFIFAKKGRSKEFVKHNEKKFGLHEEGVVYLFLSESIDVFIRNTELLKNVFIFTLQTCFFSRPRMTLGQFLKRLKEVSGTKGKIFAKEIDVNLRNALSHGLFCTDGVDVVYCEDVTLKSQKRIRLDNLWNKARKQSIITQCLISFIADWYVGT